MVCTQQVLGPEDRGRGAVRAVVVYTGIFKRSKINKGGYLMSFPINPMTVKDLVLSNNYTGQCDELRYTVLLSHPAPNYQAFVAEPKIVSAHGANFTTFTTEDETS